MNMKTSPARVEGLDTLRAAAIALVLLTHYSGFVAHQETFGVVGSIGWAGVDMFFVLSGYLIGNPIAAAIASGQPWSLKTFFARRLIRTLPNYYVVLIAYLLFPALLGGIGMAPIWRFLTFTQNFGLAYGETFTHSWSLCVEEQFYLVLPLAAVLVMKLGCRPATLWWVLGAALAIGVIWRGAASMSNGFDSFSAEIYYSSFARFDELLFGVAIAVIRNFHAEPFARMLRRGNTLLVIGVLAAAGVLTGLAKGLPNPFVATAFGFSLLAASFGLLTLAALSPGSLLHRLRFPGAAPLARWSYAIYLAHKPIFMLIGPELARRNVDATSPSVVVPVLFAGVAGGWLLFRAVELPFLRLRGRWFPEPLGGSNPLPADEPMRRKSGAFAHDEN